MIILMFGGNELATGLYMVMFGCRLSEAAAMAVNCQVCLGLGWGQRL